MGIDWSKIRTIDDVKSLGEDELFDLTKEYDAESAFRISEGLAEEEREDAEFWSRFRRGVMLVTGPPGQGKDMFAHMLAFKFKRYFSMRAISDTKPRKDFGEYIPFSTDFLVDQLDRVMEVSTGHVKLLELPKGKPKTEDDFLQMEEIEAENERLSLFIPHVTDDGEWVSSRGVVFIRRAVWLLNEFGSRYMYKKEPNAPITRVLLKTFTIWRHLQSLIIGLGTEREDFNPQCFPKVTCEVRLQRLSSLGRRILHPKRLVFGAMIYPLRYVGATGELMVSGRPIPLIIDGDKPRDCLYGKAWKDLFNTDNAVGFEPPKSLRRKQ